MKQSNIWKIIFVGILIILGVIFFNSWTSKLTSEDASKGIVWEDSNGNGVWDDVEEKIIAKYGYSQNLKKAMFQLAIAIQKSVTENNLTVPRALEISMELLRSDECVELVDQRGDSNGLDVEAWVVNNEKKIRKYNHYNALLSGQLLDLGSDTKFCNFEIEE